MGVLRLLLAAAVVLVHLGISGVLTSGALSVQVFYMISGFLITHVLHHTPSYHRWGRFVQSRVLRLYPVYATVAAVTAGLMALGVLPAPPWERFGSGALTALALANVFIVGQDVMMFLEQGPDGIAFTPDFWQAAVPLYRGLMVPPAWSLSLELVFYALAPFLVRRRAVLLGLMVASVALRMALLKWGWGWRDPWTYRFLPTELALFGLGSLSWHFMLPRWRRWVETARVHGRRFVTAGTALLWLCCVVWGGWAVPSWLKGPLLIGTAFCLLPCAFLFSSQWAWDRRLGDLSYPLYIVHVLCIGLFHRWGWLHDGESTGLPQVLAVLGLSLGLAFLLHHLIQRPIEAWRSQVRQGPGG